MAFKTISFDAGLNTSRVGSLIESGELTRAEGSRYKANDLALWRAWGRTKYINSNGQIGGSSGKVVGLAYCPFDTTAEGISDDFLIAHRADKYYSSVFTARTGTISGTTIDNVGTGTHLDVCHANNRWYLFNGNTEGVSNRVLKPGQTNPSSRAHGLVPVATTPTSPSVTTAAGSWPTDETFWGEGRFFFFCTEVVSPGDPYDELESAASFGSPPFVDLQKDSSGSIAFDVIFTRPTNLANSTATEVRVYMAKASLYQAWDSSLLARAFRVGTISPPQTTLRLSANYTYYNPTTTPTVTVVSGSVDNPTFMAVEDGSTGDVTHGTTATVDLTNWTFLAPVGATILGMEMWIRYRNPGGGQTRINATFRTGAGPTLGTTKLFATSDSHFVLHQQGTASDTWGLSLTGSEADSTAFGIRLVITASGTSDAEIDVVKCRIYTGTIPTIGPAYPIVAIQEGNVLAIHSANSPPPVSATGDIIDGALVVDNVNNRRELAYSLPGKYDYFPAIYRMGIDSKEHDKVMVVRRIGDIGLAFMLHQVVRINHVPFSTDSEFIQGRAYEVVVPDHGCVSRQGVDVFLIPGGPTLAAYTSHNGVYMNDGARDKCMTEDLNWTAMIDVTQLSKAVLKNYAKEYVLKFDFILAGSGATENNRYILIHYHPSHRKENGHFKITGPTVLNTACATVAKIAAEQVLLIGHNSDARIYVEDNAVDDASGVGINQLFESREEYLAGRDDSFTIVEARYHTTGTGTSMTATSTPRYRNIETALTDDPNPITFDPVLEGFYLLQHHLGLIDSVRMKLSLPDEVGQNANIGWNYLLLNVNEHAKASNNKDS